LNQFGSSSTPEQIDFYACRVDGNFYALFTVYGWFGLTYSSALVAILLSLASGTLMLWLAVVFSGVFRCLRRSRGRSLSA
jgi:hypothetical protein